MIPCAPVEAPSIRNRRPGRLAFALAVLAFLVAPFLAAPALGQTAELEDEDDPLSRMVLIRVPPAGKEISVEEMVRDIGMRLNKVVAIDDALKGKKIKFYTSAEMNFYALVAVLRTYGLELVIEEAGGVEILKALLSRNIQQSTGGPTPFLPAGAKLPGGQEIVTAVYYFEHIDQTAIQQAQTAVRALMTRDARRAGHIIQVPGTNAIIITDFSSAVDFYLQIARAIDQPVPQLDYKIVQVSFALADELANLVNTLTPALDLEGGGVGGKPGQAAQPRRVSPGRAGARGGAASPGQPQVVADGRTNKLVILALPEDILKIERLIRELDVKVDPPPRHFHVYKCINANALDLADRLNALFGGATSFSQSSSRSRGRESRAGSRSSRSQPRTGALGNRQAAAQPTRAAPSRLGSAGGAANNANPGAGEIETRIVPDEQTNSLLIQAAPEDYRDILGILLELDKKRRRVLIEAKVYEIEVTDDLFFAMDLAITDDASTNRNASPIRGHGLSSSGLLSPVISDTGETLGLSPNLESLSRGGLVTFLTHGSFDQVPLIVSTLATEAKADLITSPFTMTNDGETAIFEVSQQEPFQVASSTNAAAFNGFDFAEAISSLEVTPRIASGSSLTLDVNLNISSFTGLAQGGAPPPSSGRNYQGTVTIPNRQYVVFGGFELQSVTKEKRRIPIIGDIPVLGWLFGSTSTRSVRRRIYVFVRPVIFEDESFAGDVRASRYSYEGVAASSLLGEGFLPVIPDEVMDARAPGIKAAIYASYGEGGEAAFSESDTTLNDRRAAAKAR